MATNSAAAGLPRFYTDLAELWPTLSPPSDYAAEAGAVDAILADHFGDRPLRVLELGAGGGHTLVHLSDLTGGRHDCVALDLSPAMLAQASRLIPGLRTVVGDMRTARLNETFDAVLLHDAADYLLSPDDLRATAATIAAHLRPGGLTLIAPTYTAETFVDGDAAADAEALREPDAASDRPAGANALFTYLHDPDPTDTTVEMVLLVLRRSAGGGPVEVIEDRHTCGLFPRSAWVEALASAGLSALWIEAAVDGGDAAEDDVSGPLSGSFAGGLGSGGLGSGGWALLRGLAGASS